MTICFGYPGPTITKSVTSTAASWLDPAQPSATTPNGATPLWNGRYLLSSDQPFHLDVANDATTTTSHRIPANVIVEVSMQWGQSLSYILAADATGNGTLYITRKL